MTLLQIPKNFKFKANLHSSLLQDEDNPSSSSQCTFISPIGISPTIVFDEICEHMSRGKIHKEKEIIRKV